MISVLSYIVIQARDQYWMRSAHVFYAGDLESDTVGYNVQKGSDALAVLFVHSIVA